MALDPRTEMVEQRGKVLPVRWFDCVTFDREWLKDKTIEYYRDDDDVYKPRVIDKNGIQVWP